MVIGIDIGGTKIAGIIFDGKKAVKELVIVTPKTIAEFAYSLKHLVNFLSVRQNIYGIGIGMAGIIDNKRQVAIHSPNIKYIKNFNFKGLFGSKLKTAVANDAKCFALAEAKLGQGKGFSNVVGVILGTGVGSGLVVNGEIYAGSHYGAGEVGHTYYGGRHTFESQFQKARDSHNNRQLSELVGVLLGNIYRVLDPEIIVLGGGVSTDKKRNFVDGARIICTNMLSSYKIKPRITVSKLKNAGSIGAALLVSRFPSLACLPKLQRRRDGRG